MQTTKHVPLGSITLGYVAAWTTSSIIAVFFQLVLVLVKVSRVQTLTTKTFLSTSMGLFVLYFISYLFELAAPYAGLRRWQSLAIVLVATVFVVVLANLGTRPVLLHLLFGTSMFIAFAMCTYFPGRFIGDKVIHYMEAREERIPK